MFYLNDIQTNYVLFADTQDNKVFSDDIQDKNVLF